MKALIQIGAFIAIAGFIGLTAIGWNQSEKGSPLAALHEVFDVIKIQVQGARR
jgi:hypothetical protein